jgi:hypothetical protein
VGKKAMKEFPLKKCSVPCEGSKNATGLGEIGQLPFAGKIWPTEINKCMQKWLSSPCTEVEKTQLLPFYRRSWTSHIGGRDDKAFLPRAKGRKQSHPGDGEKDQGLYALELGVHPLIQEKLLRRVEFEQGLWGWVRFGYVWIWGQEAHGVKEGAGEGLAGEYIWMEQGEWLGKSLDLETISVRNNWINLGTEGVRGYVVVADCLQVGMWIRFLCVSLAVRNELQATMASAIGISCSHRPVAADSGLVWLLHYAIDNTGFPIF